MIVKAKILVNSSVYHSETREMVGTRHCCWGECKTNSKYPEKWPVTKRVGEIGAESIHTFPKTGERPRKVQALVSGMFTGILYREKR